MTRSLRLIARYSFQALRHEAALNCQGGAVGAQPLSCNVIYLNRPGCKEPAHPLRILSKRTSNAIWLFVASRLDEANETAALGCSGPRSARSPSGVCNLCSVKIRLSIEN